MVLLDWNLPPPVYGFKVLQALRSEELVGIVPIIISKSDNKDIEYAAKEAGAACVLQKPLTLHAVEQIVNSITDFWFTIVRIPH
jgi:two-component system response regulator